MNRAACSSGVSALIGGFGEKSAPASGSGAPGLPRPAGGWEAGEGVAADGAAEDGVAADGTAEDGAAEDGVGPCCCAKTDRHAIQRRTPAGTSDGRRGREREVI